MSGTAPFRRRNSEPLRPTRWAPAIPAPALRLVPTALRPTPVSTSTLIEPLISSVGDCGARPTFLASVVDDSASVAGPAGNDPLANRYGEIRAAFRSLARCCRCGRCRAAVVHFDLVGGTDPLLVRTRGPRRGAGRRTLHPDLDAALTAPPAALGSSVLGPALDAALALVSSMPDYDTVLVVASDFQLFDPDPVEVIACLDRFARTGGGVHALVLGRPLPDGLLVPPTRSHLIRPGDPPGTLARAMAAAIAENRPPR